MLDFRFGIRCGPQYTSSERQASVYRILAKETVVRDDLHHYD
jgi:hypothetical protein